MTKIVSNINNLFSQILTGNDFCSEFVSIKPLFWISTSLECSNTINPLQMLKIFHFINDFKNAKDLTEHSKAGGGNQTDQFI